MKRTRAVLVLCMFYLSSAVALAAEVTRLLPEAETLLYNVKLAGLPVVRATFSLSTSPRSDAPLVRILEVVARTRSFASRIYRVENRYRTVIDPATGYPTRYEKICDEAKFQEYSSVRYEQSAGRALYALGDPPKRWEQRLPGRMHNLFSALYRVRVHDFGREPRYVFFLDAKGVYWRVVAERVRNLRTRDGFFWDVNVRFQKMEGDPTERQSDLLTDNIVNGEKPLKLRIRPADEAMRFPPYVVRMEYRAMGFHLVAELVERNGEKLD